MIRSRLDKWSVFLQMMTRSRRKETLNKRSGGFYQPGSLCRSPGVKHKQSFLLKCHGMTHVIFQMFTHTHTHGEEFNTWMFHPAEGI